MFAGLIRTLHSREAGFTLIELMIVILVVLILAAILIPQMGVARERASKAKCVSNQRNIETAVSMWATDNLNVPYDGGPMDGSTPAFADLTGSPSYTITAIFQEPDDPNAANATGTDYYLSEGGIGHGHGHSHGHGNPNNPTAPSYGHVVCQYAEDPGTSCGGGDPWVNCYNGNGSGTGLDHTRGAAASP
jgi:prepilin-type N-terminal cleavage/methylation domain-containing protein